MDYIRLADECDQVFSPKGHYLYVEGQTFLKFVEPEDFGRYDLKKVLFLDAEGNNASEKIPSGWRDIRLHNEVKYTVFYTCGVSDFEFLKWLEYHFTNTEKHERFYYYMLNLYREMRTITTTNDGHQKDFQKEKHLKAWLRQTEILIFGKNIHDIRTFNFSTPYIESRKKIFETLNPLLGTGNNDEVLFKNEFTSLVDCLTNWIENDELPPNRDTVISLKNDTTEFYRCIVRVLNSFGKPIKGKGIGNFFVYFKIASRKGGNNKGYLANSTIITYLKEAQQSLK